MFAFKYTVVQRINLFRADQNKMPQMSTKNSFLCCQLYFTRVLPTSFHRSPSKGNEHN